MPAVTWSKPATEEYPDFFAGYIAQLSDNANPVKQLQDSSAAMQTLVGELSEEQLLYRYDTGKWTIKEMVQHIIDAERVFAYRALGIARNDQTNFPGFDHNAYVPASKANRRSIDELLEEYQSVRQSTIYLFSSFDAEMVGRVGRSGGNALSARALAYIAAGHEMHHMKIIRERYLQ